MEGVRYVPYRLPEWVDEDAPVLIAEGERKVDALFDLGFLATCNAGGAGKFSKGFCALFPGPARRPAAGQRRRRAQARPRGRRDPRAGRVFDPDRRAARPAAQGRRDRLVAGRRDRRGAARADRGRAGREPPAPIRRGGGRRRSRRTEEEKKAKRSIATELVQIALAGTELFTTPGDQIAYAAFEIDDHREVWPLRSRGFKTWLGRRLYEETNGKKTASAQAITDALVTIEGAAMFDGAVREVYLRVAHHNGRYYLDLADDRWRAVEIAPSGWRVIDRPPVYFRRTRGTLPLPEPVPGGSLDPLRDLLNVGTRRRRQDPDRLDSGGAAPGRALSGARSRRRAGQRQEHHRARAARADRPGRADDPSRAETGA